MTDQDDPLRQMWLQQQPRRDRNAQTAARVFGYPEERAMLAAAVAEQQAADEAVPDDGNPEDYTDAEGWLAEAVQETETEEGNDDGRDQDSTDAS